MFEQNLDLRYSTAMGPWAMLRARSAVCIGLALSMLLSCVWMPLASAPYGTQCPTAPIQRIEDVQVRRDCCGRLVSQIVVRKPRPGDREFVQCRCAEKKAAETHKQANTARAPEWVVAPPDPEDPQGDAPILAAARTPVAAASPLSTTGFPPPSPPPDLI